MGHYGKHIIDPETGLCEICDRDAIREVRIGKRPGKQVYYSNHDDRLTYRPDDDEIPYGKEKYGYETNDEPTPRYARKSVYPAPTVRPRRVVYEQHVEEPIIVRRKIVRRGRISPEEVIVHRPPPPPLRSKPFYYVDKEGQMLPQNNSPPPEPPRRYIVKSHQPPPERAVRIIRRRAQTPPPPASESYRSGPRRQINSDTEIIERQQRMRHEDSYYHQSSPRKPEMFHIEANPNDNRHSPLDSPVYMSYDNNTPPPKVIYQEDGNRKQHKVAPMKQKTQNESEPTVVRRVYKKLPPGKHEPLNDEYIPNENHPRTIRKGEKNYPPPRQYVSSPEISNGNNKNPSIYYIRSTDEY